MTTLTPDDVSFFLSAPESDARFLAIAKVVNVAICEARGWRPCEPPSLAATERLTYGGKWWRHPIEKTISGLSNLPSHVLGLEALGNMNEAEEELERETGHLSRRCLIREYWLQLMQDLNPGVVLWDNGTFLGSWSNAIEVGHASSRQRAIAWLRVKKPEMFK